MNKSKIKCNYAWGSIKLNLCANKSTENIIFISYALCLSRSDLFATYQLWLFFFLTLNSFNNFFINNNKIMKSEKRLILLFIIFPLKFHTFSFNKEMECNKGKCMELIQTGIMCFSYIHNFIVQFTKKTILF